MADDDLLWRTMCEQHIERKCEKCGWGLPLLGERRRRARGAINALPAKLVEKASKESASFSRGRTSAPPTRMMNVEQGEEGTTSVGVELSEESSISVRPSKRSKTASPAPSRATTPSPASSSSRLSSMSTFTIPPIISMTRPWKSVYCERLVIERNWRRGTCVATVLTGHTDSITCLQVAEDLPHPAFPILMTGSWDRSVRIWNLESGKEVGVLRGHTRGVRALQFDAVKLVTGSMDSTLKIWNWRTGECLKTLRGHRDAVICLCYDKQLLVSGSADSTIRVWDFGTGEGYTLLGHTEWVNSVALWDSKVGCGPGQETPAESATSSTSESGAATTNPELAKASAKGKYLFSASDDMTIRVWDLYTRSCVRVLRGHVAQVQSLRVITSENNQDLPPPTFPPLTTPTSMTTTQQQYTTESEEESNRSQVVQGNAYEGFFDVRPPSTSTSSSTLPHSAPSLTAGPLPPSSALFHAAAAAALPNPDFATLPLLEFTGEERPLIVSASLDNTIKIWDVEAGVCQRTMFGHIEGVWDVDVDKLRIVSGSHDRTLKVPFFLSLSLRRQRFKELIDVIETV